MDKMLSMIKLALAVLLAVVMLWRAPAVLRPMQTYITTAAAQITVPERLATTEQRLASLEHRLDEHEQEQRDIHLSERLAKIEARQESVLLLLTPVALFLFTHTLEVGLRMWRGRKMQRVPDNSETDTVITRRTHKNRPRVDREE